MSKRAHQSWHRPKIMNRRARDWEDTQLYNRWKKNVVKGRPNDFVIALSASSKTGVSGTGKTTAATALAEEFDITDNPWDAEQYGTTEVDHLAYNILPEAEEGAALLQEEAQGTPSGTGLNKMRMMNEEAMGAINGILANRDNRNTVIIVVQQLSMLNSSLIPLLDAWLLIRHEPDDHRGPLMIHHEVHGEDYELKNDQIKTPAIEELEWPPLVDDANYRTMEKKKQQAKIRDAGDDRPNIPKGAMSKSQRDEKICALYENGDMTQGDLADIFDMEQGTISKIINGGA